MRSNTPCGRMSILKWAILFILGIITSFILYGLSSGVNMAIRPVLGQMPAMIGCCAAMLGIYYLCVRVFEKRSASEISLKKVIPDTAKGLGVGVLYFISIIIVMSLLGVYRITSFQFDLEGQLKAFFMFMMVAVGEEFIFRAILFRTIDERFGFWWAIAISALVFGLVHISNDNATWWSSLAIALEAGIMLALAYKYTNTLWFPIGIHWAWNYTQGNILGFAVSGTDAGTTLFSSTVSGPDILSGGDFGAEASLIAVIIGLAISVFFYLEIKKRESDVVEIPAVEKEESNES